MVYAAEPAGTGWLKPAVALMVICVLSPVHMPPKTIPPLGTVDDLTLAPLTVSINAERLRSVARADYLRRAS
jgi:uncharacterized membrane protein YkvA (DUF1232 family)